MPIFVMQLEEILYIILPIGIDVREKISRNFKFHNGNFVLEVGSIAGSIPQSSTYLI